MGPCRCGSIGQLSAARGWRRQIAAIRRLAVVVPGVVVGVDGFHHRRAAIVVVGVAGVVQAAAAAVVMDIAVAVIVVVVRPVPIDSGRTWLRWATVRTCITINCCGAHTLPALCLLGKGASTHPFPCGRSIAVHRRGHLVSVVSECMNESDGRI